MNETLTDRQSLGREIRMDFEMRLHRTERGQIWGRPEGFDVALLGRSPWEAILHTAAWLADRVSAEYDRAAVNP